MPSQTNAPFECQTKQCFFSKSCFLFVLFSRPKFIHKKGVYAVSGKAKQFLKLYVDTILLCCSFNIPFFSFNDL